MNAEEKVSWLNVCDPFRQWSVGQDVFCLHCDGVFKAEDVLRDYVGHPTCPLCISSTPIDFAEIPWWREDLVAEKVNKNGFVRKWRIKPIKAIAGRPVYLPARENKGNENFRN
jgi:hypothetical protein